MERFKIGFEQNEMDLKVKFQKAKEERSFCEVINKLDLSEEILRKYTTSLKESAKEFEHCKKCTGIDKCRNSIKGSFLLPKKNNNGIEFSYVNCRYTNKEKYKDNISVFDLPLRLKDAAISNIYTDDKSRIEIIKKMKEFTDSYLSGDRPRGIYLYGSFGVGKSYLIAALFNELAKKNIKSVIVHVPELIRSIKESFESDYSQRFDLVKNTPLLLLDDIGAEYLTAWARDEVLEPILQYRMDQELPTFFTSNCNLKELEKHFTLGEDRLKAKRIIERVTQVSIPVELVSKNMRNK